MKAIYVILEGRLGNNLWQIAAAATLAERLQVPYYAVPNKYYFCPEPDNCFFSDYIAPFRKTIFRDVPFAEEVPINSTHVDFGYQGHETMQIQGDYVCLHCCYPNIQTISIPIVQKLFAPSVDICTTLKKKYPVLAEHNTCSIVVRRGDYLHIPITNPAEDYYYYWSCMRKVRKLLGTKDVHYVIISDDEEWSSKHFRGKNICVIRNEPPLMDLYISSLCTCNVLSNSTFALWGGVLNIAKNKIVLYPTPWMGIGMRKQTQYVPVCPADWIPIRHYSIHYLKGVFLWGYNKIKDLLIKKCVHKDHKKEK